MRGSPFLMNSSLSRLAVTNGLSSVSEHTEERSEFVSEATPGGTAQDRTSKHVFSWLAVTNRLDGVRQENKEYKINIYVLHNYIKRKQPTTDTNQYAYANVLNTKRVCRSSFLQVK